MGKRPKTEREPTLADVVRFTWLDWLLLLLMAGCLAGILFRPPFLDPATFALWGAVFFTLIVWNMLHRLIREVQRLRRRMDELQARLRAMEDLLEKRRGGW